MWWTRLSLVAIAMMLGAPNWLALMVRAEPAEQWVGVNRKVAFNLDQGWGEVHVVQS